MTPHRRSAAPGLQALLALGVLLAPGASRAAASAPRARPATHEARPRSVILMIPDGAGWASVALARIVAGRPLALDSILVGACETRSLDSLITDSAASATAYASGVKTKNRVLGLDGHDLPVATVLEGAKARGLSTALVATSRITHATPAAFAAHVPERNEENDIAVQELEHRIDVLLGGGRREFLPRSAGGRRADGRDLVAEARRSGYTVVTTRSELAAVQGGPLLGLFTSDHMNYEMDRDTLAEPSLAGMTRRCLAILSRNPRGFFVMIEGSRVDHAAHVNDAAAHASDLIAYDDAVEAALRFARRDRRTLVISVADHECGGMSVGSWSFRDSMSAIWPAALRRQHASAEKMAERIAAGERPEVVIARDGGIGDLAPEELAAVQNAIARHRFVAENLGTIMSRRARVGWTTYSHTGEDVGLYAFGPGAERLRGTHDNTEIGRTIATLLGIDLDALTAEMRRAGARARR